MRTAGSLISLFVLSAPFEFSNMAPQVGFVLYQQDLSEQQKYCFILYFFFFFVF